jgi:hypothetical protein
MAKEAGTGWSTLSVDDSGGSARAIVNDITSVTISTPRGVQETTGMDKTAFERVLLLADAQITLEGVFNDASNLSHAVFATTSSTSVARTVTAVVSGQTLANEMFPIDYNLTRVATGELTWSVPLVLAGGVVPTWS